MNRFLSLAATIALSAAFSTQAAVITVKPQDANNAGVAQTVPFGAPPVGGIVGASLISFGIDFSYGNPDAYFSDPPLAFCGVSAANLCDLEAAVDGRIVVQGTLNQGLTSFLEIEAGRFDAPSNGTLSVFDVNSALLTSVSGSGTGPNGRDLFTVSRASADIAYFVMSGADTFGVNQIRLETPLDAGTPGGVPEPATLALVGLSLLGLAVARRRKA